MRLSEIDRLNSPDHAARLLKLLEYPEAEAIMALTEQYNLTTDEAKATLAAQD